MSCYVTIKGEPYTKEQFIELMKKEGIRALQPSGDLTEDASRILTKYDYKAYDESVMEMVARLANKGEFDHLPTADEVNSLIYPKGALTDYNAQAAIHANTYSGVRITGIAANFGKALGYLFESTFPQALLHGATIYVDTDNPNFQEVANKMADKYSNYIVKEVPFKELAKEQRKKSVQDLLGSGFDVAYRPEPKFDLSKIKSIIFDGQEFDGLSRVEKGSTFIGNIVNVFETIDTVINLAIDNVKEQKLFVLGITGSNANAFLTAVGMGIPLNNIVRLFKSPAIARLSENRRITTDIIREELTNVRTALLVQYTSDSAKFMERAQKYAGPQAVQSLNTKTGEKLIKGLEGVLSLRSSVLEDQIMGKADTIDSLLSDYAALSSMLSLVTVGEEMFAYAQLFSTLRSIPSTKWRMDYLADKILDYNTPTVYEWITDNVKPTYKKELINKWRKEANYDSLSKEDKAVVDADIEEKLKLPLVEQAVATEAGQIGRKSFENAILRKVDLRDIRNTEKSVFLDATPLAIPHVFSAWASLMRVKKLIESTFALHSPRVREFCSKILNEANMYKSYAPQQQVELIQNELAKYLGSNVKLTTAYGQIDMRIDPKMSSGNLLGVDAWADNYVKKLVKLAKETDNELLRNMEFAMDADGVRRILLTADKSGDIETLEELRRGFLELRETNPELALDLFKYAVRVQGLSYGRSNLALIFSDDLIAAYSQEFDKVINSILVRGDDGGVVPGHTAKNLNTIFSRFLFQFMRNNNTLVRHKSGATPMKSATYKNAKGYKKEAFFGVDRFEGTQIFYDLKFSATVDEAKTYPRFLTRYGNEVYIKIDSPSNGYVYYRVLADKGRYPAYDFSEEHLNKKLDLDFFSSPDNNIQDARQIVSSNKIEYPEGVRRYEVGDIVKFIDRSTPSPTTVKVVRITSEGKETPSNGFEYNYTLIEEQSLEVPLSSEELAAVESLLSPPETVNVLTRTKSSAVLNMVNSSRSSIVGIIGDYKTSVDNPNVIRLPLNQIKSNMTLDEMDQVLKSIDALLESVKDRKSVVVDSSMLAPVAGVNEDMAREIVLRLYRKFGYLAPQASLLEEAPVGEERVGLVEGALAIKRITSGLEYLPEVDNWDEGRKMFYGVQDEVPPGMYNRFEVGRIFYAGVTETGNQFGHIRAKEGNKFYYVLFDDIVAAHLDETSYPAEVIDKLINENDPC